MRKRINQILRTLRAKKKKMAQKSEPAPKPSVKKASKPDKPVKPVKKARPGKPSVSKTKTAGKPLLGVELEPPPEGEKGVEILRVIEGSSADKAGLKQYDIIMKINGSPVNKVEEVRGHIAKAGVGGKLEMVIDRYGKITKVSVKVGARPEPTQ